jgi:mono/diheme cytochrome c family protein
MDGSADLYRRGFIHRTLVLHLENGIRSSGMSRLATLVIGALVIGWIGLSSAAAATQNPGGSPEARKVKNPVAPTAASLKAGQQLYEKNCQFCHGPAGQGDGRLAPKGVKPANLTDAEWVRGSTDGEIFAVIAHGAGPEFKMKGVKPRIADTDIWHIVNYIRTLGSKTAAR